MKILSTVVGYVTADEDGSLRIIDPPKPCHGYENCCVCPDCVERAAGPLPAAPQPRQPWEIAA